MRTYVQKTTKDSFIVYKETTTQSIMSDFMTLLVVLGIIGADITFSLLIQHSYVIDILAIILTWVYLSHESSKREVKTKEELDAILKDIIN